MLSDVAAQQAQVDLDQNQLRSQRRCCCAAGTVSQAVFDQAHYTLENDKGKLAALQQQARCSWPSSAATPDTPTTEHPQYRQAKAQVDEAQRQLDHTVVTAPFAGTVTNVPSIAPGKYLAASTTAFFLVDTDHVWVDATPKETELTYVRPGQNGDGDRRHLSGCRMARRCRKREPGGGAGILACCRRRTPAATG